MKKIFLKKMACMLMLVFGTTIAHASPVSILDQGGWFESGYVTWQKVAGLEYNVYVKESAASEWTLLDDELVREYPTYGRADALGLKAGSYQFKVVPVNNGEEVTADAQTSSAFVVNAHDRSGFAHKQAGSEGIGAYNNDGTLKEGAHVVYVTANNAKTVSLDIATSSNGKKATYTGLQQIIYGYQKGDNNGSYEKAPLCIRIIGTIKDADMDKFLSSAEGIQIKGAKAYQPMNITIEGVGNDATIWGFGFLLRSVSKVELRNFAIMYCMDDCVSIDTNNSMIWVHNLDLFYGQPGSDSDQVKGDGTIDMKGNSQYLTISYNHLYDSGKASLCGMKSESGPNWITYHHNWFDHSDSRHPRIRTMSVHVYNNYFDGNAKYGVGAAYQSNAFVENNYFRNCKYPMLMSMQGSDMDGGKGTFSSEDGGVIKSFGNVIKGAKKVVTYQQDNTEFDCYEATTRNEQVPANVKAKQGGKTYTNFDTDASIMYTYTPDAAQNIPGIIKGQYGAGRMQHGDFKWTFDNSVQDANYDVIPDLKSAVQNYASTLIGFFDGSTISNGGATTTVDAGDGKGISEEVNNNVEASWGSGGGSSSPSTASPGKYVIGTKENYFWFNEANATQFDAYVTAGNFILGSSESDGVVFNATREITNSKVGSCSDYIGSVLLPAGKSLTAYYADGIVGISFYVSSNGSQTWKLEKSADGITWQDAGTVTGATGGHPSCSVTASNEEAIKFVRITNNASGGRDIQGIKIATFDPDANPEEDAGGDNDEEQKSSDATAEFTLNDEDIVFSGTTYTLNVAHDANDASGYSVVIIPADNATIAAVNGATGEGNNYTIAAPAIGQTVTATFRILAENGANTKTYTINIVKGADPASIPIETGNIMLEYNNIPEGYKIDGSSSVTQFSYSGNELFNASANLFKAAAAQHTVTLPANAKITKIVMYGVVDNNSTKTAGKITELAGQTFDVSLPSRKTGTAFATATVDNVEITGSFTYTVGYAAGVKFALTVEQNDGGGTTPGGGDNPQPQGMEKAYIATTSDSGFDYYWFNAESETEVNGWLSDGTITLTNGTGTGDGQAKSSFKKDVQPTINPGQETEQKSEKIGTIEIAKAGSKGGTDGGTITFYCSKGVETFKAYMFRTGTYNFHVYKSTDGNNFTEIAKDETTGKGKLDVDYSSILKTTSPVWVRIQNTSTGGLNIQGVEITYLEPTGIQTITDNKSVKAGVMYDLQGRRIVTPAKGQLYIMDGKKFVNK